MRKYEIVFILDDQAYTDSGERFIGRDIPRLIEELGGEVVSTEKMGRRQLAYEIKKRSTGIYWDIVANMPAEQINVFKAKYRLDSNILRLGIFVYDRPANAKVMRELPDIPTEA